MGEPMVVVQKLPFFQLFVISNIVYEHLFSNILKGKNAFKAIKKRSLKSRKIDIFPKGLTHGFGPKMAICLTFFFRQYRPGKYLERYPRMKKRLSRE